MSFAKHVFPVLIAMVFLTGNGFAQFWQLPGSADLSEGVSDNGVVSGPGYYWTEKDGLIDIGGLPAGDGIGNQFKISNDGTRISGSILNTQTGLADSAYFDIPTSQWVLVGGLGSSCDAESSGGWNISGDGQQVVGLAWLPGCDAHAFIGNENSVTDLGSTSAGNPSRANGVDADGNVICGWQEGNGRQGAVWVDGVQELITLKNGDPAEEAAAVTNDGRFVTGIGVGPINGPPQSTYRYDTTTNTTIEIPNIANGGMRLFGGVGITDDGKTIVGGTWGFGPAILGTAVIWREGEGTIRFSDYLDEEGVEYPAGFNFAFISDVSSDGTWFTGWSLDGTWAVHVPNEDNVTRPELFTLFRGQIISSELSDYFDSDDQRATFNPGFVLNTIEAPVWLIFQATAPNASELFIESQAGTPGITMTIEQWNYDVGFYDSQTVVEAESFNADSVVTMNVEPDFIALDGEVRARIGWRRTGFTINFPWEVRVDQVGWIN